MKMWAVALFALVMGTAANAASYTCTGGTGDVSISVERRGVLEVSNSECSVTLVFVRASSLFSVFRGVPGPSSDTELCGQSAIVSTGIFQLAPRVEMNLQGGESQARYECTLDR
jgi:hypothetical protein